ncbi:hypothetical protein [Streptomyces sp. YU58]|uniref:hypothetical protein n=1 Tax=Streptomyces sp. SX92 TaxID=3158972 RepID=UPI0027BAD884|nr:hypothetical protein [Streptomyces coralus]WLW51758.1 hypothetical protein QU709_10400 [Streptomyces coralus]
MGVFARLLRRSKTTEEATAAEVQAADASTDEKGEQAEEAAEAKGSAEAGADVEAKAETGTGDAAEEKTAAADKDTSGEGVEIPKQQSAEEVADSEAGEGART